MYIAVDGDDVGRRFEERLSECINVDDVIALHQWSYKLQQDLSDYMIEIMESWEGNFLARTGDGFLAAFPASHFEGLKDCFRPRLLDATVTTGIGPSVKDAYMALKLGKARNRGGGLFFSFAPPKEKILWIGPAYRTSGHILENGEPPSDVNL